MNLAARVLALIEPGDQGRALALLAIMTATAAVDAAGVLSVMPFLALAANPGAIQTSDWLAALHRAVGAPPPGQFVAAAGFATMAIVVLGNILRALLDWLTFRFAFSQEHLLSRRLLANYAAQGYEFFLARNSADLVRRALSEVHTAVQGLIIPLLHICSKLVAAALIVSLLVVINPAVALTLFGVLSAAYGVTYWAAHRRLGRIGIERDASNALRFRTTARLLDGIKEIKLYHRAGMLLRDFDRAARGVATTQAQSQTLGQLPRHALEALAYCAIVLVTISLVGGAPGDGDAIALIGLFAFGGYRLMPALQHIFSGATSLRFHEHLLGQLEKDLALDGSGSPPAGAALGLRRAIELRDVTFTHQGQRGASIQGVSLTIRAGSTVGIAGPTGAGKSTLVDVILGLLEPGSGNLYIDDRRIDDSTRAAWQASVACVPQQIYLADDTVGHNIAFGAPEIPPERIEEAARLACIHDFVMTLPSGYGTEVGERGVRLSGGERQRIGIARALCRKPDLLVLDEATASLDNLTEASVIENVRSAAGGATLIMVAHRLDTLRRCDTILLMDKGRLVASGSFTELSRDQEIFRSMVGAQEGGAR